MEQLPELVHITKDHWSAQRMVATRVSRLRRLKKLDAPADVIARQEELLEKAVNQLADHPGNWWKDRDFAQEGVEVPGA